MVIYKITNLLNGKIYIGQTIQENPKQRWWDHLADADSGCKGHLYNSIRKYGKQYFVWKIVDEATDIDMLNNKEDKWLESYKKIATVYNIRKAGNNKLHAPESIERMRIAQKEAHARRRREGTEGGWTRKDGGAMKGKSHTKETKKKMVVAHKNRPPVTDEVRKRMSKSACQRPVRFHTEETKKKMSIAARSRPTKAPVSEETKRKISESVKLSWSKR